MSNPAKKDDAANPMWGGHFSRGPAEIMAEINASIDTDKRMFRQDIAGSRAHVRMLAAQKILSTDDRDAILKGLDQVESELEAGTLPFKNELEDIHMHVEARLKEIIGTPAGRLHTARSRNDQVATDFRLYTRDALDTVSHAIKELQQALVTQAEAHAESVMPGFTHLQIAQPITFGHHMLAYVEMLERDLGRLADAQTRLNQSPLGAAALAGTSFPIDRQSTAEALGFDGVMGNSLDAVSDRDFVLESLSACSILMVHLSRLAEELIMWMSPAFGFVSLSHGYTTGSSIMPQKRNPDAAELVRGKAGGVFGTLQGMLTMMKALPLTYSKDMQEDKAPFFEVLDTLALCLPAMRGMIADMAVHPDAMLALARKGFSTATDLADWLVRELGMPFRDAHHVTGRMVCAAEERNCRLDELPLNIMQEIEPCITESIMQVLDVTQAVHSRTSEGGTAPTRVRERVAYWQEHLA